MYCLEIPNNSYKKEQHWSAEPSAQARCVWFCFCLCKVVFQKLSYSLCGLCLSLSSLITLPQTVPFIAFSGSPTAVHRAFLFKSMQRHGHSYKLTSSRALQYYTEGIPFWTSHKDSHKCLSLMEKPQYHVLQLMWSHIYRYVRVTER